MCISKRPTCIRKRPRIIVKSSSRNSFLWNANQKNTRSFYIQLYSFMYMDIYCVKRASDGDHDMPFTYILMAVPRICYDVIYYRRFFIYVACQTSYSTHSVLNAWLNLICINLFLKLMFHFIFSRYVCE